MSTGTNESEFSLLSEAKRMKHWTVEVGAAVWSSVCAHMFGLAIVPLSSITIIDVTAPLAVERPI